MADWPYLNRAARSEGLDGTVLAEGVRGDGSLPRPATCLPRGDGLSSSAHRVGCAGCRLYRAQHSAVWDGRAEEAASTADDRRRNGVVPGLLRARGGRRPAVAA